MQGLAPARLLALIVPAALMAGALGSQYIGGLYPCEMCHWQRWPHYAAIALAALAFLLPGRGLRSFLVVFAGLAIITSGLIGVFHAGVEYRWWEGLTSCSVTSAAGSASQVLADIMATPLIRCDQPQWTLFGISLAGYNALISIPAGLWVLALLARKGRA
ncbi:disulfide bond formation protein B [Aquisediminimonas sediminicola]|uniref:disulfide bond formation protein B n=1 Tax=Alteraquisediminimonas sediminicola TaxID=2676787 RepID=UPI001C8D7A0A|nr:disulfide bond formation protein B [Aquisediminimonas sediminicola]